MKPVCIAIVDAANARLYSYHGEVFREVMDLVNPGRRGKDRDLFSTTKPGQRNGIRTTDDHRDQHRAHWDHEFAKQIVAECFELARNRQFDHLIFVSTPRLLGELRKVSEPLRRAGVKVDELERDL